MSIFIKMVKIEADVKDILEVPAYLIVCGGRATRRRASLCWTAMMDGFHAQEDACVPHQGLAALVSTLLLH